MPQYLLRETRCGPGHRGKKQPRSIILKVNSCIREKEEAKDILQITLEIIMDQDDINPEEPKLSRLQEAIAHLIGKIADLSDKIGIRYFSLILNSPTLHNKK